MGGKAVKETEAEIAARLSKENKMSVGRFRKKKMREEVSKVNDQIEERIESGVDEMDPELAKLYDKQNDLELRLDFEDMIDPDPTDFADGGVAGLLGERQNFAMGKRAFLKLMGGVGAGIAGLKSGLLGFGKGATKKAVTETVKQSAGSGTVPPYFLNLVKKIKTLGDDTLATQDKAVAKKYKDYTMEEDFAGNIEIIKKGDDVAEDVFMSYKVDDVPVKGKKGSTKVEEYEEFTARPDRDGKMKDVEPGVPDEVVQEGTMFEDNMTEFGMTKKADGGRIGYNVGKRVFGLMNLINKKFGKGTMTTAEKLKRPKKALDREMFKKADKRLSDKKMLDDDEYQDFLDEIGGSGS